MPQEGTAAWRGSDCKVPAPALLRGMHLGQGIATGINLFPSMSHLYRSSRNKDSLTKPRHPDWKVL